jgi:hypothetical protein
MQNNYRCKDDDVKMSENDEQTKCAKWQYEGKETTNKQTTKWKAIVDMKTMMWKWVNNDQQTKWTCAKWLYENEWITNKANN